MFLNPLRNRTIEVSKDPSYLIGGGSYKGLVFSNTPFRLLGVFQSYGCPHPPDKGQHSCLARDTIPHVPPLGIIIKHSPNISLDVRVALVYIFPGAVGKLRGNNSAWVSQKQNSLKGNDLT